MVSYLSQSAKLHDDPHGVFCDNSDQLNDVRMVKLTHRHYKMMKCQVCRLGWLYYSDEEHPYRLLGGTFLWRCLMCSFCRSWWQHAELACPMKQTVRANKSLEIKRLTLHGTLMYPGKLGKKILLLKANCKSVYAVRSLLEYAGVFAPTGLL